MKVHLVISLVVALAVLSSCSSDELEEFTPDDDRQLGNAIFERVLSDTSLVVVSREQFPASYAYVDNLLAEVLASPQIVFGPDTAIFDWTVTLLDDDRLLSSFNAPGGHLFVYTGFLFFLDKEDDLAGLFGYEVSHVDQRQTSKNLQRIYGVSGLKNIASGSSIESLDGIIDQISGNTQTFSYGAGDERRADTLSVKYLADTRYACNGVADVFDKLIRFQDQRESPFLDLHDVTEDRIEVINTFAGTLPCDTEVDNESAAQYQDFRNTLP